jgi:hypothetical protein
MTDGRRSDPPQGFTPALGFAALTPLYDAAIAVFTREARWRDALTAAIDMRRALKPGGRLRIADYGLQRTPAMRLAFRNTVQRLDGIADTQPNAEGVLPALMESEGFTSVSEAEVIPTLSGSISIYTANN